MKPHGLIPFSFALVLSATILILPPQAKAVLKDKVNDCDLIVQDVRDVCTEIEDDYQSEVADHLDELRSTKAPASMSSAARRLRQVRLSEATAARIYARECRAELDSVPTICRTHEDYLDLAEGVNKAKDSAIDFEVEANKLQSIANSVSKSPEVKALNQILPGLIDLLSDSGSPIQKAGVKPNVPRVPANEPAIPEKK